MRVPTYLHGPDGLAPGPTLTISQQRLDDWKPSTHRHFVERFVALWALRVSKGRYPDDEGQAWPADLRPLDAGDVVLVGETALTPKPDPCLVLEWATVPPEDLPR